MKAHHQHPASLENQLRSALLAGDANLSQAILSEYVEALRASWESLSERERSSSPIPRQARELLTWARELTLVRRALTSEQLARVERAIRYHPGSAAPASAIEYRG